MLFTILSGGSLADILISLLLCMPVILLALSFHETAHGFAAWKCGDNTAHNLGRLSLNPLRHLDPVGFLCMLVFGYGWAKPVPVNTRNFRNPKRDMALTAAAGPGANLLLGLLSALLFGVSLAFYSHLFYKAEASFLTNCLYYVCQLMAISAEVNFLFMSFNLIPLPPFDGSRIALAFLPTRIYFSIMRYERQIMFGLLIVLLILSRFGFSPFGLLAEWLTESIALPIANGIFGLLRG